jgi:hypothetical protein
MPAAKETVSMPFADGCAQAVTSAAIQAYPSLRDISNTLHQHLLARGYVPFMRSLGQRYGHKAALFLGLCLYWTRHNARSGARRGGWVHLSARDIEQATALTRHEQDSARALLLKSNVLEHCVMGCPRVAHYRVKLDRMPPGLTLAAPDPEDRDQSGWFHGAICFFRPLGDLAGSAGAGLLLSYLLRHIRADLLSGRTREGHLQISAQQIERALCLSPKVQRLARNKLHQAGLLTEYRHGRLRVNLAAVLNCVQAQSMAPLPGFGHVPRTTPAAQDEVAPIPVLRAVVSAPARKHVALPPERRLPNPRYILLGHPCADWTVLPIAGLIHKAPRSRSATAQTGTQAPFSSAESGNWKLPKPASLIQTTKQKTTTSKRCLRSDDGPPDLRLVKAVWRQARTPDGFHTTNDNDTTPRNGLEGLVLPPLLDEVFVQPVSRVLANTPKGLRQALLDEFDGQIRLLKKPIHNPAGWMLEVRRRCLEEGAVLALAEKVARERTRTTRAARVSVVTPPTPPEPPSDPAIRRRYLALLSDLRADIVASRGAVR